MVPCGCTLPDKLAISQVGPHSPPGFNRLLIVEADGADGADWLLLGPLQIRELVSAMAALQKCF